MKKSREELLQERVRKLESVVNNEICTDEVLKKIYYSHIDYLNDEIKKIKKRTYQSDQTKSMSK